MPRSDFGASDGPIGRHFQKKRATASSKRGKDHTSIPKLDQAFSFGQTVVGNDDTGATEGVTVRRTAPSASYAPQLVNGSYLSAIPPSCTWKRIVPTKPRFGQCPFRSIFELLRGSVPKRVWTQLPKRTARATNTPHRLKVGSLDRPVRIGKEP